MQTPRIANVHACVCSILTPTKKNDVFCFILDLRVLDLLAHELEPRHTRRDLLRVGLEQQLDVLAAAQKQRQQHEEGASYVVMTKRVI